MCANPQFPANLVTFTREILNGKIHFLCSVESKVNIQNPNYLLFFTRLKTSYNFPGERRSRDLVTSFCFFSLVELYFQSFPLMLFKIVTAVIFSMYFQVPRSGSFLQKD